ncbi:MAG: TetR family transcriptional regulator [Pseudomonadales bacterium]
MTARPQRARSTAQKQLRRADILDAADRHLAEVGFEAFSMASLGRLAGVAKGTLYLYFETREDVLLALFIARLDAWRSAMEEHTPARDTDAAFAQRFHAEASAQANLLPLMARLDSVIEHNVTLPTLIAAKRRMDATLRDLAGILAPRLALPPGAMLEAIHVLGALLLGAAQMDAGPCLDSPDIPRDVRQIVTRFSSDELFTRNAVRILDGIRHDTHTETGDHAI